MAVSIFKIILHLLFVLVLRWIFNFQNKVKPVPLILMQINVPLSAVNEIRVDQFG